MELRRHRPARLAAAAIVGCFVAVALSSCSSGPLASGPAATVDGVEISRDELTNYLDATDAFYAQAADLGFASKEEADAFLANSLGAGTDTLARARVSSALSQLIDSELVRAELEANDALPSDEDLDAVRAELDQQGADKISQIDPAFLQYSIESRANTQALAKLRAAEADEGVVQPDPDEVEAQRDERYPEIVEEQPYCVSAIQVDTEEAAQAAVDRIEAGEDFAAVADEVAPSQSPGGFLGCASLEDLQGYVGSTDTSFEAGQLFGPTQSASAEGAVSWRVAEVTATTGPTREQAQAQLESEIPSEIAPTDPSALDIETLIAELREDADVTVDPQFGSWDAESFTIAPPYPGTTTTAPDVVVPGS